jgi:hypothetical protein
LLLLLLNSFRGYGIDIIVTWRRHGQAAYVINSSLFNNYFILGILYLWARMWQLKFTSYVIIYEKSVFLRLLIISVTCSLITPLVSSDYPFGVFGLPLWCLLITPLVSSDYTFGVFWLPLWCLRITPLGSSDYPFGAF